MIVDCGTCAVRGDACGDCVVSVLLGPPPRSGFEREEAQALHNLASAGMVPRLRMVSGGGGNGAGSGRCGGGGSGHGSGRGVARDVGS